jgi:putative sterol carrier protein
MGSLPPDVATRSRWLVAAMLAFHDETQRIARPTTWELRLTDGPFTVRAEGATLTVTAGAPDTADLVITTEDDELHRLLTQRVTPADAVATGTVVIAGDASALVRLVELFAFPALG